MTEAVAGRSSERDGEGIGLQRQPLAVRADDLELVGAPGADIGDEDFPDAGVAALAHHMAPAVPVVEVADDRDAPGVRRPDGEMEAVAPSWSSGCAPILSKSRRCEPSAM